MKKVFLLIFLVFILSACTQSIPQTPQNNSICLKEKYKKELKEQTFILGESMSHLICFDEFESEQLHINNFYNFRQSVSDKDTLFFEHNVSTLGLFFVGLEPSENQRCKTQIIKYNIKSNKKELILTSPNIPVMSYNTVAPYLGGYCTGEISSDSNGNIINSIVSQYDIASKTYYYHTLNSDEIPTVCGFDDHNILALSGDSNDNILEYKISLINTETKNQKIIISKILNKNDETLNGTCIYDICSQDQKIYTLETDEQINQDSKTFIRVYNLKGYLLREYYLDTNKIGTPICIGNGELCINNKLISIKTNYGYYILTPNKEPFKISSVNSNSKNLFFAGKSGDYFIYYEENLYNDENGEIVLHAVDTKTFKDRLYYLLFDNSLYQFVSINITLDNTLVAELEKRENQSMYKHNTCFYFIYNFIDDIKRETK